MLKMYDIMYALYYSLIHPYMNYALEVWYCAPAYQRNKITVLQKKSVRCINKLEYNAHTAEAFRDMRLPKLDEMFDCAIAVYMYKVLNIENFDAELSHSLIRADAVHNYSTRQADKFVLPRIHYEM